MQRIFQAVAWLLAGTIVVLSLSPPSVQPTTGAAHGLEHFLIFLATGIAFGFGYSRRAGLLMVALDVRGCDRGRAKLDSRSPREDERFLGRCGGIVSWSWTIVRVFEIKSGGNPKVSNPTEGFPAREGVCLQKERGREGDRSQALDRAQAPLPRLRDPARAGRPYPIAFTGGID
jgi:hypothetical protein